MVKPAGKMNSVFFTSQMDLEPTKFCALLHSRVLPTNIKLGWRDLPGINTMPWKDLIKNEVNLIILIVS